MEYNFSKKKKTHKNPLFKEPKYFENKKNKNTIKRTPLDGYASIKNYFDM